MVYGSIVNGVDCFKSSPDYFQRNQKTGLKNVNWEYADMKDLSVSRNHTCASSLEGAQCASYANKDSSNLTPSPLHDKNRSKIS